MGTVSYTTHLFRFGRENDDSKQIEEMENNKFLILPKKEIEITGDAGKLTNKVKAHAKSIFRWDNALIRHTIGRVDALFKTAVLYPLAIAAQTIKIGAKIALFPISISPLGSLFLGPNWTPAGILRDAAVLTSFGVQMTRSLTHVIRAPSVETKHSKKIIKNNFTMIFFGGKKHFRYRGYHIMPVRVTWKKAILWTQRKELLNTDQRNKILRATTEGMKFGIEAFKRYYLATDEYYRHQ